MLNLLFQDNSFTWNAVGRSVCQLFSIREKHISHFSRTIEKDCFSLCFSVHERVWVFHCVPINGYCVTHSIILNPVIQKCVWWFQVWIFKEQDKLSYFLRHWCYYISTRNFRYCLMIYCLQTTVHRILPNFTQVFTSLRY